jgi:hypothetical protein
MPSGCAEHNFGSSAKFGFGVSSTQWLPGSILGEI